MTPRPVPPSPDSLARFHLQLSARLWTELGESGLLSDLPREAYDDAQWEWDALALYAVVRGIVAGAGFSRETADVIDAFHAALAEGWRAAGAADAAHAQRLARVADRHGEYGRIGQSLEHAGAHLVGPRIGAACAAHLAILGARHPELGETLGDLHESIVEGTMTFVREGGA